MEIRQRSRRRQSESIVLFFECTSRSTVVGLFIILSTSTRSSRFFQLLTGSEQTTTPLIPPQRSFSDITAPKDK